MINDVRDNPSLVIPHIFGPNSDCPDSLLRSPPVATLIAVRIVSEIMRDAINFNRDRSRFAEEIENERPVWMLPSKLQTFWAQLQDSPEPDL